MTAKQKANQARFKKVVAEAKKLRKKNPKLTQAQAVKQAWAIMYSEKKVSGYSKERNKIHKNATTWIKRFKKRNDDDYETAVKKAYDHAAFGPVPGMGAVKKKAAKKKEAPKKSSSYHKDTKSHNVNIRVMSGVKEYSGKVLDELNATLNRISNAEIAIDKLKTGIKYKQFKTEDIAEAKRRLKKYSDYVKSLKKHFKELKKLV